jgi:hypothetical protein
MSYHSKRKLLVQTSKPQPSDFAGDLIFKYMERESLEKEGYKKEIIEVQDDAYSNVDNESLWLFIKHCPLDSSIYFFAKESGLFFIYFHDGCWHTWTNLMKRENKVFKTEEEAFAYCRLQLHRYTLDRYKKTARVTSPYSWGRLRKELRNRIEVKLPINNEMS